MQVTPDYNPVLDRHPVHSNIVFGAGFSGMELNHVCVWEGRGVCGARGGGGGG